MSAVALTATKISPVFADDCEIRSFIAGASITAGDPVYIDSSGNAQLADGNGSGTKQFMGVALSTVGSGQVVSVLRRGECYGFTLTSLAYGALVYVSDSVGTYQDSTGTVAIQVGRVLPLSDPDRTKVLFIDASMNRDWS